VRAAADEHQVFPEQIGGAKRTQRATGRTDNPDVISLLQANDAA
jgi:hypothetical protein